MRTHPTASLPQRQQDVWGSGAFGAPRGDRTHRGIDYACQPGTTIYPVRPGTVTRLGYPYADDLSFRYVEVTDVYNYRCRYFYVEPEVEVGQRVKVTTPLGCTQKLGERYPEITEHVHIEVLTVTGGIMNPQEYIDA